MKNEFNAGVEAAKVAGEIIMGYYHDSYEIQEKGYHNPVTTADHEADKYLRETLTAAFPEYGWLSEETVDSKDRLNSKRCWVVDPLDGTKEFIEGVPQFVVSVALVEDGSPIIGILYNPATKDLFTAIHGQGASFNGKSISCSNETDLKKVTILNSRSETRRGLWEPFKDTFGELKAIGSVAFKLGLTASAQADFFATLRPKNEWDVCAGHCIVNEAGGDLVKLDGSVLKYNQPVTLFKPGLMAGRQELIEKALKIFN